jgi:hypothetical protein
VSALPSLLVRGLAKLVVRVTATGAPKEANVAQPSEPALYNPPMDDYLTFRSLVPEFSNTPIRLATAFLLLGWAPGAVLAAAEGTLLPGGQVGWHCYMLDPLVLSIIITSPVLVFLGLSLENNLNQTIKSLDRAGILPPDREPFEQARVLTNRLNGSIWFLRAVFVFSILAGLPFFAVHFNSDLPTWYGWSGAPSLAGAWFTVSVNSFFLYVLYSWSLRGLGWAWLMIGVARCDLRLNPTHPDRCCGLMTFSRSTTRWAMLLAVAGIALTSHITNTVYFQGLPFLRFDVLVHILSYLLVGPIIGLVPLFSFTPRLLRARRRAELSISYFASAYARALRSKMREQQDPLDLDGPISGMADLYQVYANVTTLKWAPIDTRGLVRSTVFILGPLVPIILPTALMWAYTTIWA